MPTGVEPTFPNLVSQVCTAAQMRSREYLAWCDFLKCQNETLHRKVWEYCYILQVIEEHLGFEQGMRGLGFGVGQDRLAESFAALGCSVVATDQARHDAEKQGWIKTNQYASTLEALNKMKICDPDRFRERVRFEVADMNAIASHYRDFDFVWSACAFEHLGSIDLGLQFVENAMQCLRPGGWAVHTTEFNLVSNDRTVDERPTVLFRRRDMEELGRRLTALGHSVLAFNFHAGTDPIDHHVDIPPYPRSPHLRLLISGYTATSIGIAVRRGP
jgi:2-polyprenyl-3-methyl-5-hydroxy-6-metoxy-1,4-benzoquinol methylase